MKTVTLWHGDCLELMKNIPDGSVDLVLTDPPYGTMKGAPIDSWKKETTVQSGTQFLIPRKCFLIFQEFCVETERLFCFAKSHIQAN